MRRLASLLVAATVACSAHEVDEPGAAAGWDDVGEGGAGGTGDLLTSTGTDPWGCPGEPTACPSSEDEECELVCMDCCTCSCTSIPNLCGAPVGFTPDVDECLEASCCGEVLECLGPEEDAGACNDCLFERSGPRCDALIECAATARCADNFGWYLCGIPGLSAGDAALDACLTRRCCTRLDDCIGADGERLEECQACLDAGGGSRCSAFLSCGWAHCAELLGAGGAGAGGAAATGGADAGP